MTFLKRKTSPSVAVAPVSLLILGDVGATEMRDVAAFVQNAVGKSGIRTAGRVADVRSLLESTSWYPDLIVAFQTWSDQFSPAEVLELISLAPLARLVAVAGIWCDGDGRTRAAWPLAVRVRIPDAILRIQRELTDLAEARAGSPLQRSALTGQPDGSAKQLPLTASRGEIFEADCAPCAVSSSVAFGVMVDSADRAWKRMVEQALSANSLADGADDPRPGVMIFDADPWGESRRERLQSLRSRWPDVQVIVCTGDVAHAGCEALRRAEGDVCWFKLSPVATLRTLLEERR